MMLSAFHAPAIASRVWPNRAMAPRMPRSVNLPWWCVSVTQGSSGTHGPPEFHRSTRDLGRRHKTGTHALGRMTPGSVSASSTRMRGNPGSTHRPTVSSCTLTSIVPMPDELFRCTVHPDPIRIILMFLLTLYPEFPYGVFKCLISFWPFLSVHIYFMLVLMADERADHTSDSIETFVI